MISLEILNTHSDYENSHVPCLPIIYSIFAPMTAFMNKTQCSYSIHTLTPKQYRSSICTYIR